MDEQQKTTTSPPDKIYEATTPPGQGELDQEAFDKARERLEFAAGFSRQ